MSSLVRVKVIQGFSAVNVSSIRECLENTGIFLGVRVGLGGLDGLGGSCGNAWSCN